MNFHHDNHNHITDLTHILNKISVIENPSAEELRKHALENEEVTKSKEGPLVYVSDEDSKGRSPHSTYIVDDTPGVDWDRMIGLPRATFELLWEQAVQKVESSGHVYFMNRAIGADPAYTMPVTLVTNMATTALFLETMLRPASDFEESVYKEDGLVMLSLPWERINHSKLAEHHIRALTPEGSSKPNSKVVIMDPIHSIALIMGDSYNGPEKKTPYTMYNYRLAKRKVLPMHCSANVGADGKSALFFGLSGTGKTTLSADPDRPLVGDDEHGWGPHGVFNFENGCYAKTIGITGESEPEIYKAAHSEDAIIENVAVHDDGGFNFFDTKTHSTANGRVAYPLTSLENIAPQLTDRPANIFILSYDAFGVLPPISKLNKKQAMLFFLLGFTSKVAGTESGVTEPEVTFSPCLGGPFFPSEPLVYANMLGEYLENYDDINVWFMNTGNNGKGERMSLHDTRAMLSAALNGDLAKVDYKTDEFFGVETPTSCPDVDDYVLDPTTSWNTHEEYSEKAKELAALFSNKLRDYSKSTIEELQDVCPGW